MATKTAWGGRFQESLDAHAAHFLESVRFDSKLAEEDIAGSLAHAQMLHAIGVLRADELAAEALRADIAAHGIRNGHLLSIAPTGTISLAFADNASSGIEPAFAWEFTLRVRTPHGDETVNVPAAFRANPVTGVVLEAARACPPDACGD